MGFSTSNGTGNTRSTEKLVPAYFHSTIKLFQILWIADSCGEPGSAVRNVSELPTKLLVDLLDWVLSLWFHPAWAQLGTLIPWTWALLLGHAAQKPPDPNRIFFGASDEDEVVIAISADIRALVSQVLGILACVGVSESTSPPTTLPPPPHSFSVSVLIHATRACLCGKGPNSGPSAALLGSLVCHPSTFYAQTLWLVRMVLWPGADSVVRAGCPLPASIVSSWQLAVAGALPALRTALRERLASTWPPILEGLTATLDLPRHSGPLLQSSPVRLPSPRSDPDDLTSPSGMTLPPGSWRAAADPLPSRSHSWSQAARIAEFLSSGCSGSLRDLISWRGLLPDLGTLCGWRGPTSPESPRDLFSCHPSPKLPDTCRPSCTSRAELGDRACVPSCGQPCPGRVSCCRSGLPARHQKISLVLRYAFGLPNMGPGRL